MMAFCVLCGDPLHRYSECAGFTHREVAFYFQRDASYRIMSCDDWGSATIESIYHFLECAGAPISNCNLEVNNRPFQIADRTISCAMVGIVPGCLISVIFDSGVKAQQVAATSRCEKLPPSQNFDAAAAPSLMEADFGESGCIIRPDWPSMQRLYGKNWADFSNSAPAPREEPEEQQAVIAASILASEFVVHDSPKREENSSAPKICVSPPKQAASSSEREILQRTIFVRNIPLDATEDLIGASLSKFGVVLKQRLLRKDTQYLCWVEYSSTSEAKKAWANLRHLVLSESQSRRLEAVWAESPILSTKRTDRAASNVAAAQAAIGASETDDHVLDQLRASLSRLKDNVKQTGRRKKSNAQASFRHSLEVAKASALLFVKLGNDETFHEAQRAVDTATEHAADDAERRLQVAPLAVSLMLQRRDVMNAESIAKASAEHLNDAHFLALPAGKAVCVLNSLLLIGMLIEHVAPQTAAAIYERAHGIASDLRLHQHFLFCDAAPPQRVVQTVIGLPTIHALVLHDALVKPLFHDAVA